VSLLVPETVRRAVGSGDELALTSGAGLVVLALLVALLVEEQVAQALGNTRFRIAAPVRILGIALLLAFAFVAGLRVVDVLSHR
jgi:hypothetical protein